MSLDAEAEALKTLIATAAKAPAYDLDEVPSPAPSNYVEVHLARRDEGGPIRGDMREVTGRRLSTRVVASTLTNARLIEDRIAALFALSVHTIAGRSVHVAEETPGAAPEYDDGFYTSISDWTY